MSGKEEKVQYPSCNRAFALRMMNPNSYRQGQVSPLDREIQPIFKRSVTRSISSRSDDSSLAMIPSETPHQDMELYDIDENGMCSRKNQILSASFDTAIGLNAEKLALSPKIINEDLSMRRSLSSVDGFHKSTILKRTHPARTTMPVRIRTRSVQKDEHNHKCKSISGIQQASLNGKDHIVHVKRSNKIFDKGSSTQHTLKDRKLRHDASTEGRQRVINNTKKNTRSSSKRPTEIRTRIRSDCETKCNSKSIQQNEGKVGKAKRYYDQNQNNEDYRKKSDFSIIDHLLDEFSDHKMSPYNCSSPIEISPSEEFGKKLAEVCQLISEKHPGDFQILETLVTMQIAYEDREKQVKKSIRLLCDRVNELEDRLRTTPNIQSLVIPLLKASNSFQIELRDIFATHKDTLSKTLNSDSSLNINDLSSGFKNANLFDEIYVEANSVANHILSKQNYLWKSNDGNVLDLKASISSRDQPQQINIDNDIKKKESIDQVNVYDEQIIQVDYESKSSSSETLPIVNSSSEQVCCYKDEV